MIAKHKIYMVQNDTNPPVEFTIQNDDGTPYDLTGCTVRFKIKNNATGLVTNTSHQVVLIDDEPQGICHYNFALGDVPNAGSYTCDLEITDAGSRVQTEYAVTEIVARAEVV